MTEPTEPKTTSIQKLIDDLDKQAIELPNFQRDFLWEIDKSYDLFDSLIRDIFIGVFIFGQPDSGMYVRGIDTRKRSEIKAQRKKRTINKGSTVVLRDSRFMQEHTKTARYRIILDGQQRITSLYRAVKGFDEVWIILAPPNKTPNSTIYSLENNLFKVNGKPSAEHLSIKISDVYDIITNSHREKKIREDYYDSQPYVQKILNDPDLSEEVYEAEFDRYLESKKEIEYIIIKEKLLSYYLLDMSIDKFALFFERSNSLGIQLSFIDVLSAKIIGTFNLREEIENKESLYNTKLVPEILVRAIAFYVSGKDGGTYSIEKGFILRTLQTEHFEQHWEDVVKCYNDSLSFLVANRFICNPEYLPYDNILIPLLVFRREFGKDFNNISQAQNEFLTCWYWHTMFSQRYSGASNETTISDCITLSRVAKENYDFSGYTLHGLMRSPFEVSDATDLFDIVRPSNVIYKSVLNMLNFNLNNGLPSWTNSSRIDFSGKVDDHHIFPKSYLKEMKVPDDQINCIVNRTLMPKITNIIVGRKSPTEYISELRKSNPNISTTLEKHLVPVESLSNFDTFLQARSELIFKAIENLRSRIDTLRQQFEHFR